MYTFNEYIKFLFNILRCIPHLLVFYLHKNKPVIQADVKHALKIMGEDLDPSDESLNFKQPFGLIFLLAFSRQFRNLYYYRTRPYSFALNIICPQLPTLIFSSKHIGEGLAIINGFSTAIGAESIGKNCIIFHQVTIGGTSHGAPVVLDNVTIYAGAVIVGKITIGNNVVIGANATVTQNIPDNCTVYAPNPRVMRWSRNNIKESNNNNL